MIATDRYLKYQLIRKLPGGAMGRVYVARDTETGHEVALKLVDHGFDEDSREITEAEKRGAQLQERLCALDPRVTVIYEYGDHDGAFYIAMEYVDGEDLTHLLERQGIGIPFSLRIAADICDVLHLAHTFQGSIDGVQYRGIVHGDIKPRNIRIARDGRVKVLDFGIAKALSETRSFTRNLFGSVRYLSPERIRTGKVDAASDLWAVAVVLYEMIARRPYFDIGNPEALDTEVRNYSALRLIPSSWPDPVRRVLARALAPNISARFQTAKEFSEALKAARDKLSGQPAPTTLPEETTRTGPEDEDATRRTSSAVEDDVTARAAAEVDDATRRTAPANTPAAAAPARTPRRRDPRVTLAIRVVQALVPIYLAYWTISEVRVSREAAALQRGLESEQITDFDVAWESYRKLAAKSWLGFPLWGVRRSLRERMTAETDSILRDYRESDTPTVTEKDWQRAQRSLAHVLELDPGDKQIRGRLRIVDGHLKRIAAAKTGSARLWNDSRSDFVEASELLRRSPDPYLGLARIYAYGLKDVDKTQQAIREAGERGFKSGKRERAQLADAYKDRAALMVRQADKWRGQSQEEDYLRRAEEDYNRAEELYRSIDPFQDSSASLKLIMLRLEKIYARTQELRGR